MIDDVYQHADDELSEFYKVLVFISGEGYYFPVSLTQVGEEAAHGKLNAAFIYIYSGAFA